eukprot:TRINITY_DN13355_c0_g1::TRINITY_DN13355_c0_g1_i1::g.9567::m.9567 TRINITY_DN13355_c0_g1::TRINITY_DN13355_c0_g1_i1::g.9567  ORF type:complete len:149 (-),score=1.30,Fer4_4/PF12800.2/1.5e+03,Fer4_4/PF12800.2/0.2,DUF95/PF01944.12/0.33,DUF4083/PF13314.1/13,DUF4083/PF13314.1/98 TRINITY_DN13355_c0_g1_i1:348-794(-)
MANCSSCNIAFSRFWRHACAVRILVIASVIIPHHILVIIIVLVAILLGQFISILGIGTSNFLHHQISIRSETRALKLRTFLVMCLVISRALIEQILSGAVPQITSSDSHPHITIPCFHCRQCITFPLLLHIHDHLIAFWIQLHNHRPV